MAYYTPEVLNPDVVHERCRKARLMSGYKPYEVAGELQTDVETVAKMESKTSRSISIDYIVQLSRLCGVSSDYLLGLSDYAENDNRSIEQLSVYHSLRIEFERKALNCLEVATDRARKLSPLAYLSLAIDVITENAKRIERLREINPNFDEDIRGGASYMKFLADVDRNVVKKSSELLNRQLTGGDREKVEKLKKIITDVNTLQDDVTATLQKNDDVLKYKKVN